MSSSSYKIEETFVMKLTILFNFLPFKLLQYTTIAHLGSISITFPLQGVIDHLYFQSQEEKFKEYQKNRESAGHSCPLGMGVLMWDEVKVRDNDWFYHWIHKFLRLAVFVR